MTKDILDTSELVLHIYADALMFNKKLPEPLREIAVIKNAHLQNSPLSLPSLVSSLNILRQCGYLVNFGISNIERQSEMDMSKYSEEEKDKMYSKATELMKDILPKALKSDPATFGHFGFQDMSKKLEKITPELIEEESKDLKTIVEHLDPTTIQIVHIFDFRKMNELVLKLKAGTEFQDIKLPKLHFDEKESMLSYKALSFPISKHSNRSKPHYLLLHFQNNGFDKSFSYGDLVRDGICESISECENAHKRLNKIISQKSKKTMKSFLVFNEKKLEVNPKYLD